MEKYLNRRNFLGIIGILPLLSVTGFSNTDITQITEEKIKTNSTLIIPPPLKKGDTIAFTAPASPISRGKISNYVKYFKEKECEIIIGDTITKQNNNHRYLSETDEVRAEEFNKFIADEKIKAIICGRGGYGCMRILRLLDYESIKKNPKFIMGYSDITALLLAIYNQTGITAYHGPVASSRFTAAHKQSIDQIFFSEDAKIEYKIAEMKSTSKLDKEISIKGKLQGGNLTLVAASLGTPYAIDLTDSLFFIEDISVLAHDVDRMLAALLNAGELEKCKVILVGKMKKLEHRGNFFPNRAFTIYEILEQYSKKINVPCIYNLSFGHVESQYIFPLGMEAEININSKTINIYKK